MFSKYDNTKFFVGAFLLLLVSALLWFAYHRFYERHHQLSVKPPSQYSNIRLEAVESTLGLQASLPYSTLQHAAEQATLQTQTGSGERQTCKKILGAKACATVQWQYQIERSGEIKFERREDAVRLTLPLALSGTAGIDGRGGKLFGLRNKKFAGLIELHADLTIAIGEDWCPVLQSKLGHQWLSDPRIQLAGKLKINLRKSADKAIGAKLHTLEKQLSTLIDCNELRSTVSNNWKIHHIPVKVPGQQHGYLEFIPLSVAVSEAQPHDDHISIAFEMNATTEVVNTRENQTPLSLPPLLNEVIEPGAVEFSLLMNLSYPQIRELVSTKLLGKVQQTDNKKFSITSFDLYPSGDRLIFDLGFSAAGFGNFFKSSGQLYVSAKPVADPDTNQLRFEDMQFTRIIDSELWSVLSTVLHRRILDTLKDAAIIDLAPQVMKLEKSITDTISNPENTANIIVDSTAPEVRLVAVNPQSESLAAIIHVSTRLKATIPPEALLKK